MISVKGRRLPWREDLTVRILVKELGYKSSLLLVRVNGRVVRKAEWDDFHIPDEAKVEIRPLLAGG